MEMFISASFASFGPFFPRNKFLVAFACWWHCRSKLLPKIRTHELCTDESEFFQIWRYTDRKRNEKISRIHGRSFPFYFDGQVLQIRHSAEQCCISDTLSIHHITQFQCFQLFKHRQIFCEFKSTFHTIIFQWFQRQIIIMKSISWFIRIGGLISSKPGFRCRNARSSFAPRFANVSGCRFRG